MEADFYLNFNGKVECNVYTDYVNVDTFTHLKIVPPHDIASDFTSDIEDDFSLICETASMFPFEKNKELELLMIKTIGVKLLPKVHHLLKNCKCFELIKFCSAYNKKRAYPLLDKDILSELCKVWDFPQILSKDSTEVFRIMVYKKES